MSEAKPLVKLLDFRSVVPLLGMLGSLTEATLRYYRYWRLENRRDRIKLTFFLYAISLRILALILHELSLLRRYFMFVAVVDSEVVGFLHLTATSEHEAYFGMVVADAYQGRNIGRMLVEACVNYASMQGLGKISLEVYKDNTRAIRLYSSAGFKTVGSSPDTFLMSLDLDRLRDERASSRKKLRLLAAVNDPASGVYGCTKMFLTMCNILAERGHLVTIITRSGGLSGKSMKSKHYREILLEAAGRTVWGGYIFLLKGLLRQVQSIQHYDIVITADYEAFPSFFLGRLSHKKTVHLHYDVYLLSDFLKSWISFKDHYISVLAFRHSFSKER